MAKNVEPQIKKTGVESPKPAMWLSYQVVLSMTGRFAAALPRTPKEIEAMLTNRMPTNPPPDYIPIQQLIKDVTAKVIQPVGEGESTDKTEEEGFQFGWATFPHNDEGIYYEGRCIRGHLKDCATQISGLYEPKITALKAKVANKVYVMTDIIPLLIGDRTVGAATSLARAKVPMGTEQRFVQVMTMRGPRSTIKYVDYLEKPVLNFKLNVLNDGIITEDILRTIFDYGSVHGVGQERSQGWGRYAYTLNGK